MTRSRKKVASLDAPINRTKKASRRAMSADLFNPLMELFPSVEQLKQLATGATNIEPEDAANILTSLDGDVRASPTQLERSPIPNSPADVKKRPRGKAAAPGTQTE
jgi:hypothetical protein